MKHPSVTSNNGLFIVQVLYHTIIELDAYMHAYICTRTNAQTRSKKKIPGSVIGRHQGPTMARVALETNVDGSQLESRRVE